MCNALDSVSPTSGSSVQIGRLGVPSLIGKRITSPLLDGILNVDHRLAIVGHPVRIGDIVPANSISWHRLVSRFRMPSRSGDVKRSL